MREVKRANNNRQFGTFASFTAAMQVIGPWEIGNYQKLKLNFVTDEFPQIGPNKAVWADSHMLIIPAGIQKASPEKFAAALKFISWLSVNTVTWSATAGHVPARTDRLTARTFLDLKYQQAFARELGYTRFWTENRLDDAVHKNAVVPFLNDQMSVAQALSRMELDYNNIMSTTAE
jgi:multiple sugar transport system substrate-binding protein